MPTDTQGRIPREGDVSTPYLGDVCGESNHPSLHLYAFLASVELPAEWKVAIARAYQAAHTRQDFAS